MPTHLLFHDASDILVTKYKAKATEKVLAV